MYRFLNCATQLSFILNLAKIYIHATILIYQWIMIGNQIMQLAIPAHAVLLRGFCPVCYLLAYCACQLAHLAVFNSSFGLRVPASLNCMQNMKIMSVNLVKQFDNQHGVPSVTFLCPVRYPHCAQMEHSKQILSILFCSH